MQHVNFLNQVMYNLLVINNDYNNLSKKINRAFLALDQIDLGILINSDIELWKLLLLPVSRSFLLIC